MLTLSKLKNRKIIKGWSLTLINKVVRTSIAVRFTVTEASKKNGLKKFVE